MPTIEEIRKTVTVISKEYGVENVYLFGSYVRGDNNEDSDIYSVPTMKPEGK